MPKELTPEQRKRLKQRQMQEESENDNYMSNYAGDVMGGIKSMFSPVFTATNALKQIYNFLENRSHYDIGNLR